MGMAAPQAREGRERAGGDGDGRTIAPGGVRRGRRGCLRVADPGSILVSPRLLSSGCGAGRGSTPTRGLASSAPLSAGPQGVSGQSASRLVQAHNIPPDLGGLAALASESQAESGSVVQGAVFVRLGVVSAP